MDDVKNNGENGEGGKRISVAIGDDVDGAGSTNSASSPVHKRLRRQLTHEKDIRGTLRDSERRGTTLHPGESR